MPGQPPLRLEIRSLIADPTAAIRPRSARRPPSWRSPSNPNQTLVSVIGTVWSGIWTNPIWPSDGGFVALLTFPV